ncbi:Intraflagellar transport protein 46 like protein [Tritrichomonas foetus]|uniref:Intraflagellar transport protein 46 like protein n=1 Tax=Tritrichomonas foetus TaxID=1144522 RepID=A0A1J4KFY9_9EUKA|nr:Intraflagellar transport protein 46 like protein [Tritrichomonas foetus]|eukprot:OHT10327.1 Intraflagellar transport protein 46 like protein [Tritrichomonas foetus]
MFSDSDGDRDSSLDRRYSLDFGNNDNTNTTSGATAPDITPNSQYDRSFSFSDDDDGYQDVSQSPPRLVQPPQESTPIVGDSKYKSILDKDNDNDDDDDDGYNNYGSYSPPTKTGYQTSSLIPDNLNIGNLNDDDDADIPGASSELASLFSLIANFQPEPVDISVHWKPFIPELIPAIGSIDAFIKVPRPDSEFDDLGLVILDEPSISQSNPQVLRMELREQYGITAPGNESDGYIGFIEDVQKNRKALDSWLESIEEIHRHRPPPVLIYTSQMPEMEYLMEPWDETFEETLRSCPLPTADLDISLEEYAKIICALLEIPVKGNIIESLHHLFSLYAEFEANHYFQSQAQA